MEQLKRKEILYLNLNTKVAILSQQHSDSEKPLSDIAAAEIAKIFRNNTIYVEAHFNTSETKSEISSIIIKHSKGIDEERLPTLEEAMVLLNIRNKLFSEHNKLLQFKNGAGEGKNKEIESMIIERIDPDTGEREQLSKEDIKKLEELWEFVEENFFDEDFLNNMWIIDDDIEEILKRLKRKTTRDSFWEDN